jgi:hypothetical protein
MGEVKNAHNVSNEESWREEITLETYCMLEANIKKDLKETIYDTANWFNVAQYEPEVSSCKHDTER